MKDKLISELTKAEDILDGMATGPLTEPQLSALCQGMRICHEVADELARPTPDKAVEPLAVLADRKGKTGVSVINNGGGPWVIYISHSCHGEYLGPFSAPTYALAEAKAREYLLALPDADGKGREGK